MTHYLIAMKDGWKPGDCPNCHIKTDCMMIHPIRRIEHCPLVGAREAVHYQSLPGGVETFVVESKEKN